MTDRERRYKINSIEKDKEKIPQLSSTVKSNIITVGVSALAATVSFLMAEDTGNFFNKGMFAFVGVAGVGNGLVYSTLCVHSLFEKIGLEKEIKQFENELEEEKEKTK